jgi:hypothetical protein
MKCGLSFTILALLGLLASVAMEMDNNWLAGGGLQMLSLLVATLRWQSFSPHFEPSKER